MFEFPQRMHSIKHYVMFSHEEWEAMQAFSGPDMTPIAVKKVTYAVFTGALKLVVSTTKPKAKPKAKRKK